MRLRIDLISAEGIVPSGFSMIEKSDVAFNAEAAVSALPANKKFRRSIWISLKFNIRSFSVHNELLVSHSIFSPHKIFVKYTAFAYAGSVSRNKLPAALGHEI